jgi:hypothetical protein
MPIKRHKLCLDRDRSEEFLAGGLRRIKEAAKITFVKFGVNEMAIYRRGDTY